jgi:hypothetical protein
VDPPTLDALWLEVDAHWTDPKAHDAFLQACVDQQLLGEAARRYRALRTDQERGELASKRLDIIAFLAIQQMQARREARPPEVPRWLTWLAGAVCLAALGGLVYAMLAR